MKRYKLYGPANSNIFKDGKRILSFNDEGYVYVYEGFATEQRMKVLVNRFNGEVDEVAIITQEEYDELKNYKDKYNKVKMDVVRLKGQLKKVRHED